MAKKRQSTGLPKPRPTAKPEGESDAGSTAKGGQPLRDYKSHAEREAETQRQLVIGVSIASGIVVVLIAVALFVTLIYNPNRSVASVNGHGISVANYETRVRLERALVNEQISALAYLYVDTGVFSDPYDAVNQLYQYDENTRNSIDELSSPDRLGLRVLNDMIDEQLILQVAEERGVTVTDEEINEQVDKFLGIDRANDPYIVDPEATAEPEVTETVMPTALVSPTPTLEPTATLTPELSPAPSATPSPTLEPTATPSSTERTESLDETIAVFYRAVGRDADVSREQIRDYFRVQALREKLARELIDVPETSIWVNARHILVDTEEEARNIIDALNGGESFAELARVSSLDTGSGANGGELDWSNSYNFVEGFREAVRDQELGAISQNPIETDFGFHIIQVREREDRDIEDSEVDSILQTGFETWLEDYRNSDAVTIETSDFWPDFVPDEPVFTIRTR